MSNVSVVIPFKISLGLIASFPLTKSFFLHALKITNAAKNKNGKNQYFIMKTRPKHFHQQPYQRKQRIPLLDFLLGHNPICDNALPSQK